MQLEHGGHSWEEQWGDPKWHLSWFPCEVPAIARAGQTREAEADSAVAEPYRLSQRGQRTSIKGHPLDLGREVTK